MGQSRAFFEKTAIFGRFGSFIGGSFFPRFAGGAKTGENGHFAKNGFFRFLGRREESLFWPKMAVFGIPLIISRGGLPPGYVEKYRLSANARAL